MQGAAKNRAWFLTSLMKMYLNRARSMRESSLPMKEAIETAKSVSSSAEFLGGSR
jgi:hypothetical protein